MLETERLTIRPFQESDYIDLYEYLSLEETYRFEPGQPITLEEARNIAAERAKDSENWWAVILKNNDNKLIGHVSFFRVNPEFLNTWEIGYIFNPAFHNKEYCTEAVREILKYASKKLDAHRIVAHCSPDNIPSWKVLENCGMRREGLLRKNFLIRNDENGNPIWLDSYIYSTLAEDIN